MWSMAPWSWLLGPHPWSLLGQLECHPHSVGSHAPCTPPIRHKIKEHWSQPQAAASYRDKNQAGSGIGSLVEQYLDHPCSSHSNKGRPILSIHTDQYLHSVFMHVRSTNQPSLDHDLRSPLSISRFWGLIGANPIKEVFHFQWGSHKLFFLNHKLFINHLSGLIYIQIWSTNSKSKTLTI